MSASSFAGGMEPWLRAQARLRPDAAALVEEGGRSLSFGELAAGAEAVARRFLAAGVERGSRLALLMSASSRFVEILHGAQWIGAAVVPLNDRLGAEELRGQIEHADPFWLIYDDDHARAAEALAGTAARIEAVHAGAGFDAVAPARGAMPDRIEPSDLHSIVYTSGTAGAPKGVMLSNANHLASAKASVARLGLGEADRWLAVLPACHVGGLSILLRAAIHGTSVVLHRRFDAAAANRSVATEGVTVVSLVPAMLARMLEDAGGARFPPALRCVLLGGGAAPAELLAGAAAARAPVVCTYGLTETASQVCTATAAEAALHPGSAGRPLDGVEIRIDEPGADGFGEIVVRGPQVMAGYFRDAESTARALRGGWLHTGDIGRLDGEGRLWVLGRKDDVIVSGGEKIVPEEVESVLAAHPDVLEAAVFGEADAAWGQRVAAAVVMKPGAVLDEAALRSWCRARLGRFKAPRSVQAVAGLPRTASGKLQRRRLGDVRRRG